MSWEFWTQNNYKNTWIAGIGVASAGLLYYVWHQINKPETPEECYARAKKIFNDLSNKYDAKITAFEQGYKIAGDDITTMNEQFGCAREQWRVQIDEEALSYLGSFSGNWRTNVSADVKRLSAAKIELSKMRRQVAQENKNSLVAKQIERLLADVSLFFLRLSFLKDCVKHNELYLDFLVYEKTTSSKYAHVVNASSTHVSLKLLICKNSVEKSHPYIKFIQSLSKDTVDFAQKINQVKDTMQSTKLFRRAQQLQNVLFNIEKHIYADKTLHNDLREYQTELLRQTKKTVKTLNLSIDKAQVQANKVRGLEGRLHLAVIAYQATAMIRQNMNHNNANYVNHAIPNWEMNNLKSISDSIEKIFSEIQKARDVARLLEKEKNRIPVRFDEVSDSVPEQLRLQIKIEHVVQNGENTIKVMQNVAERARKASDELHDWARKSNLFLV